MPSNDLSGYKIQFRHMRLACAEPDGEFIPFAVLRICVEDHVPLPRWAAVELLKIGDRLMQTPNRRGHNARPVDRDCQRTIDVMRFALVERFRRIENLSWQDAVDRAVEYLQAKMPNGGEIVGPDGRRFRLDATEKGIARSWARAAKCLGFPQLRPRGLRLRYGL